MHKNPTGQAQRRAILSICHDQNWFRFEDFVTGRMMIDFTRLNHWLCTKGAVKKNLDDLDQAELNKVVTQFRQMQKKSLKPQ